MSKAEYLIRDERSGDASSITVVTDAAFAPRQYDAETLVRIAAMQKAAGISDALLADTSSALSEAGIVAALRADGALTLSLVADQSGAIVGHIAFSPVSVGDEGEGWFALGPVSVLPDHQRQGIAGSLIREGLARLRGFGAKGCVLLGYPPFYARFGFALDDGLTYHGRPNPALQRIILAGDPPKGEVVFHPAFG